MATLVYRFGVRPPHEGADLVRTQMSVGHRYRNDLVQIERTFRTVLRDIERVGDVASVEAAVRAADDRCAETGRAVKAYRSENRTRSVPDALRDALTDARVAKRDAVALLRVARDTAWSTVKAERATLNERAAEMRRGARALCGAYWGTYLLIEASDEQARKKPLYDGAEPNDPGFSRWDGSGSVGIQIQGGASEADLATNRYLRIEVGTPPPGAKPQSKRSAKRRHVVLAMRVGSEKRDPVWARWHMIMHRPLPPDAVIKQAAVHLRRIGPREEWAALLTIETGGSRGVPDGGAVALDLGWRLREERVLRVGSWIGSDGVAGEVLCPSRVPEEFTKVEELASVRGLAFDAAREELATQIRTADKTLPPWLVTSARTISQWKSPGRLAALAKRWRSQRFTDDASMYEPLERWRYHDHHLWEWQESQRTKTQRHRREVYRIAAAELGRRYETLILEDLDLRVFARRKGPPDGESVLRRQRAQVAPSELRGVLINAFGGPKSPRVVVVPAANTTRTCSACGSVERWDQAKDVVHKCHACGVAWDQDANAAKNLLAIGSEHLRERKATEGARDDGKASDNTVLRGGRWAKAKKKRAEKLAQMEVAREAVPSAAE